jgi:transposase-like protein
MLQSRLVRAVREVFTKEHIIGVLKRHEQGAQVADLPREINVAKATTYKWMSKF